MNRPGVRPRLRARDNRLIAFAEDGKLLVHDLSRGVTSRVTETSGFAEPIFSPDGRRLAYSLTNQSALGIAIRPSAGGAEEIVLRSTSPTYAEDWSSDGRFLSLHENTSTRSRGFIQSLEAGHPPLVFADLAAGAAIDEHRFSPDGRWLAYNATEGGRPEVYVVPLPPTGERWKVSVAGGAQPRWRRDGGALYYLAVSGELMIVDVKTKAGAAPQIGRPQPLFRTGLVAAANMDQYAPSADGKRFLLRRPISPGGPPELNVIVNWPALLK